MNGRTIIGPGLGLVLLAWSANPAWAVGAADKLPADADREARLLAAVGDGFKVKRTAHFLIAYNTEAGPLNDFVKRVEITHRSVHRFLRVNDIPHTEPDHRLEIYFFESVEEFLRYAASLGSDATNNAGFYDPRGNRAAFFHSLNDPRLQGANRAIQELEAKLANLQGSRHRTERKAVLKSLRTLRNKRDRLITTINQLVVQHEVAHMVLFNAGVHVRGAQNPLWLVEGLACLFETPLGPGGVGIATTNQFRLHNFRQCLSDGNPRHSLKPEDIQTAYRAGRFVSLPHLVASRSAVTDTGLVDYYAEAWSLVFYLQRQRREDLARYIGLMAEREVDRLYSADEEWEAFEAVFGPIDGKFERAWVGFILAEHYTPPRL